MRTLTFPNDLLRLLYWVFFKPITLEKYIQQYDPELDIRDSLISLWRHANDKPDVRQLVLLACFHVLFTPLLLGLGAAGVFALLGFEVNWADVAVAMASCVTFCVLLSAGGGAPSSVAFSVAFSLGVGITFIVAIGVAFGVAIGVAIGVAFGVAIGVLGGVAGGEVGRVAFGVTIGALVGVAGGLAVGVVGGVAGGLAVGAAVGATVGVSYFISYFRLYLYPFEAPLAFLLARRAQTTSAGNLFRFSPVCWDELVWLQLPGLDQHLVAIGKQDRQAAQEPIAFVAQSFRQQWAARNALVELTAYDVERAQTPQEIANIAAQFAWLPPAMPKELEDVLPPIREIAEYASAARESETLYNKQTQLRNALSQTRRVREGLALNPSRQIATRFGRALQTWEGVFERELTSLQENESIPNVYVAGSPLAKDSNVFKGRHDLFVALERELATPAEQRPTLLLFGARRTGKTSVLKQMPSRLGPDVIPVEIDLQSASTAEDASGLLAYIAERIKNNALLYRRVQLPALTREELRDDPYMTWLDWLTKVEALVGSRWILLNLDEYEHLAIMMEQGRLDERVFQFARGLIQHHPRIVVLLSGSHTIQDLPPIWSNYLVNVRVLGIGALKRDEARDLIVKPIEGFPLEYEPAAVDHLLDVTGCQPYLLQATCRDLVNALNEDKQMLATRADAERALDSALVSAGTYFSELWGGRDTDDAQREVMREVAAGQDLEGSFAAQTAADIRGQERTLRQLVHRDILEQADGGYRFRVELVRRWIQRET